MFNLFYVCAYYAYLLKIKSVAIDFLVTTVTNVFGSILDKLFTKILSKFFYYKYIVIMKITFFIFIVSGLF